MSDMDVLRIICEFDTVTVEDMADGLEMTVQGAHGVLRRLMAKRLIERVRVEHTHLYAVTSRGRAVHAKLAPVDPGERCLLLVRIVEVGNGMFVPQCPNCGVGGEHSVWRGTDGANGKWECLGCHEINLWIDAYDDIPF